MMKEFKINEYLMIKLEDGKSFIYIKGKRFKQCMRLVLSIPKEELSEYKQIDSIDEAAEVNRTLFQNTIMEIYQPHSITPEQEFWGHASNLQAWVNNDYDTRLLHSNLSFPLLRRLCEEGEPIARRVFNEEIVNRFNQGYIPVIEYLYYEDYLDGFNAEELETLLDIALKILKKTLQEEPENLRYLKLAQIIFSRIGEHEKSIELMKRIVELKPDAYAYNTLGLEFYRIKDYKMAEHYYDLSRQEDPNYHYPWSNLSEIYHMRKEHEKSIEHAKKAIEITEESYEGWFFYGIGMLKRKEQAREAIKAFQNALKVNNRMKKSYGLKDERVYFYLAKAYHVGNDIRSAMEACEKSLELKSNYLPTLRLQDKLKKK